MPSTIRVFLHTLDSIIIKHFNTGNLIMKITSQYSPYDWSWNVFIFLKTTCLFLCTIYSFFLIFFYWVLVLLLFLCRCSLHTKLKKLVCDETQLCKSNCTFFSQFVVWLLIFYDLNGFFCDAAFSVLIYI